MALQMIIDELKLNLRFYHLMLCLDICSIDKLGTLARNFFFSFAE